MDRFQLGDVARMKKAHPCGSDRWEITRTGIDFGLKCLGCGRRVMIPRTKFEKSVKELFRGGEKVDFRNGRTSQKRSSETHASDNSASEKP